MDPKTMSTLLSHGKAKYDCVYWAADTLYPVRLLQEVYRILKGIMEATKDHPKMQRSGGGAGRLCCPWGAGQPSLGTGPRGQCFALSCNAPFLMTKQQLHFSVQGFNSSSGVPAA